MNFAFQKNIIKSLPYQMFFLKYGIYVIFFQIQSDFTMDRNTISIVMPYV